MSTQLGFANRIAHKGTHGETRAFLPSATAWLCAASEIHFIPPCFYIHTFPGSLWTTTISNSSISDHLSSHFSVSRTNGPRLLLQAKVGTHPALEERLHTTAHTPKQVAFRMRVVSLPSERSARFGNSAWPGCRTANLAAFGSWSGGALEERRKPSGQRCAYARRCSEASRPRWAA